jgi:hypothetical protein
MNIFRRPDYKSDATQFLEQLKQAKPYAGRPSNAPGGPCCGTNWLTVTHGKAIRKARLRKSPTSTRQTNSLSQIRL